MFNWFIVFQMWSYNWNRWSIRFGYNTDDLRRNKLFHKISDEQHSSELRNLRPDWQTTRYELQNNGHLFFLADDRTKLTL